MPRKVEFLTAYLQLHIKKNPLDGNADEINSNSNPNSNLKSNSKSSDKRPRQCLCRTKHTFKGCCYNMKFIRSKDWKLDPAAQKQMGERIRNDSQRIKSSSQISTEKHS